MFVGVFACLVLLTTGCSSTPSSESGPHTLRGVLTLSDSSGVLLTRLPNGRCEGAAQNGFSEYVPGASVTVTGAHDHLPAAGALGSGRSSGPNGDTCSMGFTIPGVPTASFYAITAAGHLGVIHTFSDLEDSGWFVNLGMGASTGGGGVGVSAG
jgi:hypothetical protein